MRYITFAKPDRKSYEDCSAWIKTGFMSRRIYCWLKKDHEGPHETVGRWEDPPEEDPNPDEEF